MNKKILVIFVLAIISFVNNLICNFDYLIELMMSLPIEFYFLKQFKVLSFKEYFKVIYSLICYFTFFISENPLSVFKI